MDLWITDEFVVAMFREAGTVDFPIRLAWVAILIDYLELPVIVETILKFLSALESMDPSEALEGQLRP